MALRLLVEGNSIRSTERITNLDRNTLMKILVKAGEKCEKLMGRFIVSVPVKDVQADEIWSFIQKKEKQCGPDDDPNFGDAYCFVTIERHTKLVLNFALGKRDQATTDIFIEGLRHATASKNFQITTDGFKPYVSAIDNTLSDRVDSRNSSRCTALRSQVKADTRRLKWSQRRWSQLSETPSRNASAHRTSSARTSPCGCRFDDSRG